jgi:CO/xanthine dehydrogenase FAD-binding subunit
LAGGTIVNAGESAQPIELVDLQDLGLDQISLDGTSLRVGAMVRLTDFLAHDATPDVVKDVAAREGPNTFRNAGTVGGAVALGNPESELLAGLLAYEARITVARAGGSTDRVELDDLLDDRGILDGAIITEVSIGATGRAAVARTGRTPADTSIVAVVGRQVDDGLRLGITGVADRPVLVDRAQVETLNPPGDFRGSSEYRRHLARTLTVRVVEELREQP